MSAEATKTYRVTLKDEYNTTCITKNLDKLKELPKFKKYWGTAKIEEITGQVDQSLLLEE